MTPAVWHFFDTRTSSLAFVAFDPASRDAVVIDPVLDYEPVGSRTLTESVDAVIAFVRAERLKVHYVLETHAHADHLSGSQLIRKEFGAQLAIGEHIRAVQTAFKRIFDLPAEFACDGRQFDRLLVAGETLEAGSLRVEVIATPGHTPACVTYRIDDALFVGDALFMDDYGTGRCDFPGGSAEALFDSVQRLYQLPDDTRVFVGHDYQPEGRALRWETTIGASKQKNPQLSASTTREAFVAMRKKRDAGMASPKLLFQSVQVNINGGRLPEQNANGARFLRLPINLFQPSDEFGRPRPKG